MNNPKVAAIVPAFNEEKNISLVLKVLLQSKELDEIILVDDGSKDNTAMVGRQLGVMVLQLPKNIGKGGAMKQGVMATGAPIIVFFDADLVDLSMNHISQLIGPVREGMAAMCVGMRGRLFDMPKLIIAIDPLMAIGGERAMRREVFEGINQRLLDGFMVETALNYYCIVKKLPVAYADLKGLKIIVKEKKWGILKGFANRLKMMWQMAKIRGLIIFSKNMFV